MASARQVSGWLLAMGAAAALAEPPPDAPATAEPPPSMEMLLYLGEFETTEGETLDPMALTEESNPPAPGQKPRPEPRHDEERPNHAAARR